VAGALAGLAGPMTVVSGRPAAAVERAVEELTVENARGGAAAARPRTRAGYAIPSSSP
jgi:hypothetical protein